MRGNIIIKYNYLSEIAKTLPDAVDLLVRKAALDIRANAKAYVPVRIGKLKGSIDTVFPKKLRAIIAPHTDYAVFVEYGTRYMQPRPYMRPAAETVWPGFVQAMSKLEGLIK